MENARFYTRFYNRHLPNAVRVFHTPRQAIRCFDDVAKVYDVRAESDLILRHYAFFQHWFEVNCTLSPSGAFVAEDGPFPWCFNCDVATPAVMIGRDTYNVDLFLDVLVGTDGRTFIIKDEDEFERAIANGWVTDNEQAGARAGLEELLGLIRTETFVQFLEQTCPFTEVAGSDVPLAPSVVSLSIDDVPLYGHSFRKQHRRRKDD